MYLKYYNLKKEPFHITPDPEFLYLSPSHKQALATIIYGIEHRKGFVTIIGAPGVGKTTIIRTYLESIDKEQIKVIYIFNARLTFEDVLKTIHVELGKEISNNNIFDMINSVNELLIEEYKQGNTIVLIIDEVQNVPITTLENLRMLSNLETSKEKLLQMVLVGQPEFEEGLNLSKMQQLKQRIVVQTKILPLNQVESIEYIRHRLQIAGSNTDDILTSGALKRIVKKANGIPRTLNILCANVFINGFACQQKPVNTKVVKEVIADLEHSKKQPFKKWYYAAGFAALVLLITAFLFFSFGMKPSWNFFTTGSSGKSVKVPAEGQVLPKVDSTSQQANPDKLPEGQPAVAKQVPAGPKDAQVAPAEPVVSEMAEPRPQPKLKVGRPTASAEVVGRQKVIVKSAPKAGSSQKTVQKGDTLTRITEEVYGTADSKVFKLIQENNPQITDPNLIKTGTKILLPPAPADQTPGKRVE